MTTISTFLHARDREPKTEEVDLLEFLNIKSPILPNQEKTELPAWSPTIYREGSTKGTVGVEAVTAIVLDYDAGDTPFVEAMLPWPYRSAVYTTFSHTPEKPRFRVVIPLARPCPVELYPRLWLWARSRCVGTIDESCKDPGRIWFRPTEAATVIAITTGDDLDIDPATLPEPPPQYATLDASTVPTDRAYVTDVHINRWRSKLFTAVDDIKGLKENRRTAIRAHAYHLAGWVWMHDALPKELFDGLLDAAKQAGYSPAKASDVIASAAKAGSKRPLPASDLVANTPTIDHTSSNPPLIAIKQGVFVFSPDTNRYIASDRTNCFAHLKHHPKVAGRIADEKGRPYSFAKLMLDFGVEALKFEVRYSKPEKPWDPDTQTLALNYLPAIRATPSHHDNVHAWLMAGLSECDEPTKTAVLDWLATVTTLDMPTSAIYLHGPPGTGKGMFVNAVASIWGSRVKPIPLETAIGQWNYELSFSPIVHLDEGAKVDEISTNRFRTLVAERHHHLTEKHKPNYELVGCPRVIVTANNNDALKFGDVPSLNDMKAIAGRILYVPWSARAAEHLGPHTVEQGWVLGEEGGPGLIAEHILSLDRVSERGKADRYLVEGVPCDFHRDLVIALPRNQEVLDAICQALQAPQIHRKGISWTRGKGAVNVSLEYLFANWATLCVSGKRYNRANLAYALNALSEEGGHKNGVWQVNAAIVKSYIKKVGQSEPAEVSLGKEAH